MQQQPSNSGTFYTQYSCNGNFSNVTEVKPRFYGNTLKSGRKKYTKEVFKVMKYL